jgi:hypothetical protein
MTDTIKSFQTKIKIGAEQSYKNLAMFPLLSDYSISSKYLTMNEALSNGLIERDSMDEIKSVPKFKIADISDDNDCVAASWDYIEQFARVDGQIGAIFLINGKIAGMVCLDRTKTFEISFIKIVECYAKKADGEYDSTMDMISSKSDIRNGLKAPFASCIEIQSAAGNEPESCL